MQHSKQALSIPELIKFRSQQPSEILLSPSFKRFFDLKYDDSLESLSLGINDSIASSLEGIGDDVPFMISINKIMNSSYAARQLYTQRGSNFIQGVLSPYIYLAMNGVNFKTTDALVKLIKFIDLDPSIPARLLQSPYPATYFSFEENRELLDLEAISTSSRGLYTGFYVFDHIITDESFIKNSTKIQMEAKNSKKVRSLQFVFTSNGLKKGCRLADLDPSLCNEEWVNVGMYIYDEEESLLDVLERNLTSLQEIEKQAISEAFNFAVKLILYISSKEVRRVVSKDHSDLERKIKGVTNKAKLRKLKKKLLSASNYVHVGESSYDFIESYTAAESKGHGSVKPHYRRGHIRTYYRGTDKEFTRNILPVFVNARLTDAVKEEKKTYKVK